MNRIAQSRYSKFAYWGVGVVCLLFAAAFALSLMVDDTKTMTVAYYGEEYQLPTQPSGDADFTVDQAEKIELIIRKEPAPAFLPNYTGLISFLNKLEVPGYGSSTGGYGRQTTAGQYTFISMEIPHKKQHRVFIYERDSHEATYSYVDDFIYDGFLPPVIRFEAEADTLVCRIHRSKEIVRRIPLRSS